MARYQMRRARHERMQASVSRGGVMACSRFDRLTRLLASRLARRTMVAAALGYPLLAANRRGAVAGPGCKNLGKKCLNAVDCCSNLCKGKKGKKRCRAHDTGGCMEGINVCGLGIAGLALATPCTTSSGQTGFCLVTTGNAPYCAALGFGCDACTRDRDCLATVGPGSACIVCVGCRGDRTCAKSSFP